RPDRGWGWRSRSVSLRECLPDRGGAGAHLGADVGVAVELLAERLGEPLEAGEPPRGARVAVLAEGVGGDLDAPTGGPGLFDGGEEVGHEPQGEVEAGGLALVGVDLAGGGEVLLDLAGVGVDEADDGRSHDAPSGNSNGSVPGP